MLLEQFLPGVCLHLFELSQLLNHFLVFFFLLLELLVRSLALRVFLLHSRKFGFRLLELLLELMLLLDKLDPGFVVVVKFHTLLGKAARQRQLLPSLQLGLFL